nr:MAG TPA: hypothetical protein [Caudoviricetes sp.]
MDVFEPFARYVVAYSVRKLGHGLSVSRVCYLSALCVNKSKNIMWGVRSRTSWRLSARPVCGSTITSRCRKKKNT